MRRRGHPTGPAQKTAARGVAPRAVFCGFCGPNHPRHARVSRPTSHVKDHMAAAAFPRGDSRFWGVRHETRDVKNREAKRDWSLLLPPPSQFVHSSKAKTILFTRNDFWQWLYFSSRIFNQNKGMLSILDPCLSRKDFGIYIYGYFTKCPSAVASAIFQWHRQFVRHETISKPFLPGDRFISFQYFKNISFIVALRVIRPPTVTNEKRGQ